MATQAQILANRKNSKLSTGAKTHEGKEKISLNAVKHGITSFNEVIYSENPNELEELRNAFILEYNPATPTEMAILDMAILSLWRMKRVYRAENSKFLKEKFDDIIKIGFSKKRSLFDKSDISSISRYSSNLERSFYKAVQQLRLLQSNRTTESNNVVLTDNNHE